MSNDVDYYDVERMIQDAKTDVRSDIREAVRESRVQTDEQIAELRRELDSLQRALDDRTGHLA